MSQSNRSPALADMPRGEFFEPCAHCGWPVDLADLGRSAASSIRIAAAHADCFVEAQKILDREAVGS